MSRSRSQKSSPTERKHSADKSGRFPQAEKVQLLATLGAVGETTATVLVAEVYHRSFETRRHVASFVGLAPSPYKSGDTDRDRGISKAGTKLARQTLVELAWFWLRYQPNSKLSLWWHERFGDKGMRGRKVGIVALARKLGNRPVALRRARGRSGGSHAEGLDQEDFDYELAAPAVRRSGDRED